MAKKSVKRTQKSNSNKMFVLVMVLVVLSLVVDLLSLNALYDLKEDKGLKGELASLTQEYCEDLAEEAYDECLEDAYTIVEGYFPGSSSYGYYPSGSEEECEQVARNAMSACMALVEPEPDPHYY